MRLTQRGIRSAELPQRVLLTCCVFDGGVARAGLLQERDGAAGIAHSDGQHAEIREGVAFDPGVSERPTRD